LPWVFAGILDRRRVSVSYVCQSREQVGLAGQHHLSLVLNGLDREEGVAGVLLDLPVDLGLSRVTHYKQSGRGERSRKQHKPHQQLGAQSQVGPALKEGFQYPAYSCEMNRLSPVMRGRKKASRIHLGR
jgi:hypothetical protein